MDYLGILGQLFAYLVVFGIIVGFVIVTKKCFFEKYTFGNIIVPIILSPILSNFLAHLFTERMCYSNDLKESVSGFVLYSIIQIAFCLVQLLIYVKFVKAPNTSIAIFIYLCCMVFFRYFRKQKNLMHIQDAQHLFRFHRNVGNIPEYCKSQSYLIRYTRQD